MGRLNCLVLVTLAVSAAASTEVNSARVVPGNAWPPGTGTMVRILKRAGPLDYIRLHPSASDGVSALDESTYFMPKSDPFLRTSRYSPEVEENNGGYWLPNNANVREDNGGSRRHQNNNLGLTEEQKILLASKFWAILN